MATALISAGCSSSKTAIIERDTVTVYKDLDDSVRIITKVQVKDSVRIKDSTVTTVNERGDVLKQEIWHDREHVSSVSDSTQYYKRQYEELQSAYIKLKEESRKTTSPVLTTKEKLEYGGKGAIAGIVISFLIALVLWFALRKKPP